MTISTHNALPDPRNEDILIYINGNLVPRADAKISVFDSGYLVGDGIWAKYWYHNVHQSTGFKRYESPVKIIPEQLQSLLEKCLPLYNEVSNLAIQAQ